MVTVAFWSGCTHVFGVQRLRLCRALRVRSVCAHAVRRMAQFAQLERGVLVASGAGRPSRAPFAFWAPAGGREGARLRRVLRAVLRPGRVLSVLELLTVVTVGVCLCACTCRVRRLSAGPVEACMYINISMP